MKKVPCDDCLNQFISTRHALHGVIQTLQTENRLLKAENARLREKNSDLVFEEIRLRLDRQDAAPQHQPLAWMYTGIKSDGSEHGPHLVWKPEYMDAMSASKGAKATPLYTTPPQPQQVTDPIGRPRTLTLGQKLRRGIERQRMQPITKQEGAAS